MKKHLPESLNQCFNGIRYNRKNVYFCKCYKSFDNHNPDPKVKNPNSTSTIQIQNHNIVFYCLTYYKKRVKTSQTNSTFIVFYRWRVKPGKCPRPKWQRTGWSLLSVKSPPFGMVVVMPDHSVAKPLLGQSFLFD